jgi:hypothetical protein
MATTAKKQQVCPNKKCGGTNFENWDSVLTCVSCGTVSLFLLFIHVVLYQGDAKFANYIIFEQLNFCVRRSHNLNLLLNAIQILLTYSQLMYNIFR